ncbi:MAG TPA: hypothetical protein VF263_03540, partial [Longimicrobiaceae bacterium]
MERPADRDPWVVGGLVLLALLTLGSVLLYRSAPQSVAEARSRSWVAVRPSAFAPRFARAGERARAAAAALASGDTAAAVREYAVAAVEAEQARALAGSDAERAAAAELWAAALLDRAGLMLGAAASPWWRRDDDPALREALASVERVRAAPVRPATRARADALAESLRRQLRPG